MDLLPGLVLRAGEHRSLDEGACVMEAVAYIAGEPWSDHPQCACPVITRFLLNWNDAMRSDEERTRLLAPLIPRIIGTRATLAVEWARSWMALDWMVREMAPAWLDAAKLPERASALRAVSPVVDSESARAAQAALNAAWDAARAAAWDAAWDAAGAAAGAAAWAAKAAAWDAAWDAAKAAAGDAAWDALAPTVSALQQSARELVNRMCEVRNA